MKWVTAIGYTVLIAGILLAEWIALREQHKREKTALAVLSLLAWSLGIALIIEPLLPNPYQLIDVWFKPIGEWMKK